MKQLDLEAIEARCEVARREVNRLCQGKTSWTMSVPVRQDDTDVILTDSFRDIPPLVIEIKRLRTEVERWKVIAEERWVVMRRLRAHIGSEHRLMMMYSDREAAVRRKLREVDAVAPHEEITNLDAITRLATQKEGPELQAEVKRLRASLEAVLEEATSDLDIEILSSLSVSPHSHKEA